jgi:hypothetical protein
MPVTYPRAFGLNDNPFDPCKPKLLGVERKWIDNLVTRPLRIDLEPRLMPLFVPAAGPFEQHLEEFRFKLEMAGYSAPPDPEVGGRSFAFLITGPKGTGKSTLASVMVHWLTECAGGKDQLAVIRNSQKEADGPKFAEQIKVQVIKEVQPDSLCCLVLDDVDIATKNSLLEVYLELVDDAGILLLMFLLSSNPDVIQEVGNDNARVVVDRYVMPPLSPERAASYVRQRTLHFRPEQFRPYFEAFDTFPFNADNIRSAIAPPTSNGQTNEAGLVTLRMLNRILADALAKTARALPDDYDIKAIPPEKLPESFIDLKVSFQEMVTP